MTGHSLSFVDHASEGNLSEVQMCLAAHQSEVNVMLALAAACRGGHRSVVKTLLPHVPRPTPKSQDFVAALSAAMLSHSFDIVPDLLAHCSATVRAQLVPRLATQALSIRRGGPIFNELLIHDRPALKEMIESEQALITAIRGDSPSGQIATLLSYLPFSVKCQKATMVAIAHEKIAQVHLLASRTDIPYVLSQVLSAHKDHNSSIKMDNPTTEACVEALIPHLSDVQFEALSKTMPPFIQIPAWSQRLEALQTKQILNTAVKENPPSTLVASKKKM